MKKIIGNPVVFTLIYIVFMIPTYLLPYIGSNSSLLNAAGAASGAGMNPAFWLHLLALLILVWIAWLRGSVVGKSWIVVFPFLALVFDLAPGLNVIPLVPTVMHLLAIIIGVSSAGVVVQESIKEEV